MEEKKTPKNNSTVSLNRRLCVAEKLILLNMLKNEASTLHLITMKFQGLQ